MKRKFKILLCAAVLIFTAIAPGLNFSAYAKTDKIDGEYVVFTKENIETEDMRKKSDLDEQKLTEYMKRYPGLSGIEKTLMEIQDEYNVNAILILAIVRLESGNGRSNIAQTRNNLGGIVVTERSVAVYKSFDSKDECVIYMAKLLSESYLTEGGRFFSGYTLTDISKRYSAASVKWTELVKQLMYEIQLGIDMIEI